MQTHSIEMHDWLKVHYFDGFLIFELYCNAAQQYPAELKIVQSA